MSSEVISIIQYVIYDTYRNRNMDANKLYREKLWSLEATILHKAVSKICTIVANVDNAHMCHVLFKCHIEKTFLYYLDMLFGIIEIKILLDVNK